MKRILLTLILFASLFTSNLYSNTSEIPNEKVFDNPKKEVTTVEAKKNKEHAEMNIAVNKLNIQEIEGHDIGNGKTQYFIPKEEKKNKLLRSLINNTDNQYLIFETKEQLSDYLNKNKKARNKRDVANPIQYEVMQDENQTMLTVNSNKDVFILDNMNNVYFGKVLNDPTDYAAVLRFDMDKKWLKHFFLSRREKLSELRTKTLAKVFIHGFLNNEHSTSNYFIANGWKTNKLIINTNNENQEHILGYSGNLFQEKIYDGIEYVYGNTTTTSLVGVVLNMQQKRKTIARREVLDESTFNFNKIANYNFFHVKTYLRLNPSGVAASLVPGHLFEFNLRNMDFLDYGMKTDIEINVLKKDLSNTSTIINSDDSLEFTYNDFNSGGLTSGNYMYGHVDDVYQTIKDSRQGSFYISGGSNLSINYNSNDKRPPITISNFDVGSSKKSTVTADLNVRLPWGDYRLRRYTINVNLVDPNTNPLILNLGGKYSDYFYIYNRSRNFFIAENVHNMHQAMEHALINSTNRFLENVDMNTLRISATGDPTNLSSTYDNGQITVTTERGQFSLKRKSSYSEAINTTFYLVGRNRSTGKRDATKVQVTAPRIETSEKIHRVQYDPRYIVERFGAEYKILLDDTMYSKFINHKSDISSSFRGYITKTNGICTQGMGGVVWIGLKGNVGLQTYDNVFYDSKLTNYTLNFFDEIPPSPTKIESTMYLSGQDVDYSNVKLIIEKANSLDARIKNGSGTIDLTLATPNKEYSFNSSSLQNENLKLENSGDFIDAKSIFDNSSLINKIKVNSGQLLSNALYSDSDVEFRIDSSGNFLIKRKNEGEFLLRTYSIEYYYNDVKLGSYQLNVKADKKPQVVLEGIDKINFGSLIPEKTSSLQSNFTVKNLNGANITLKVPIESQMIQKGVTSKINNTIPLKIESTQENNGNNINGWLRVSATPPKGTTPGEYEGTINLTVTIE